MKKLRLTYLLLCFSLVLSVNAFAVDITTPENTIPLEVGSYPGIESDNTIFDDNYIDEHLNPTPKDLKPSKDQINQANDYIKRANNILRQVNKTLDEYPDVIPFAGNSYYDENKLQLRQANFIELILNIDEGLTSTIPFSYVNQIRAFSTLCSPMII